MNDQDKIFAEVFAVVMLILVFSLVVGSIVVGYSGTCNNVTEVDSSSSNFTITSLSNLLSDGDSITSLTAQRYNQTWLEFDGDADYINLTGNIPDIQLGNFSISFWMNVATFETDNVYEVYNLANATSNNDIYFLVRHQDLGDVNLSIFSVHNETSGGWNQITWCNDCTEDDNATWLDNEWYHIVTEFNGTDLSMYINGTLVKTASMIGTRGNLTSNKFFIGSSTNNLYNFNGSIDEFRVYNRTLSQNEVKQIYNSGRIANYSLPSENLVLWFKFNENNANNLYQLYNYIQIISLNKTEYYEEGGDSIYGINGNYYGAQTFTIGTLSEDLNYNLKNVSISIGTFGSPDNLTIAIRNVDGDGLPDGNDIVNKTIIGADISPSIIDGWINFSIETTLNSSTQYAIIAYSPGSSGGDTTVWHFNNNPANYSGGQFIQSTDSGSSWSNDSTKDFKFIIYSDSSIETLNSLGRSNVISDATWSNDGNLINLTEGVDYSIDSETGIITFTSDYIYDWISINWNYLTIIGGSCAFLEMITSVGSAFGIAILAIISMIGVIGTIVGLRWLLKAIKGDSKRDNLINIAA